MELGSRVTLKQVICFGVAGAVGLIVWLMPTPIGLTPMGQKSLAVFLAALLLLILRPTHTAICMIGVLAVAAFAGIEAPGRTTVQLVFSGFSVPAFWLITTAFIIGIAVSHTGLGERIAYKLISKFGKSSLRTGYALTLSNYAVSPVTPAIVARGAGIFLPISRGICAARGWKPRYSRYIMLTSAMATHTSGGAFMTAAASGPIIAALASGILGVEISWLLWFMAALPATLTLLLLQPWIIHKLYPPESNLRSAPNAEKIARRRLAEIGPLSTQEKILLVVFAVVVGLWAAQLIHGINAALVGLLGVTILMFTAVIKLEDLTTINFNILLTLGFFLSLVAMAGGNGVFVWLAGGMTSVLGPLSPMIFLVLAAVILCYFHLPFVAVSSMALVFAPVIFTVALGMNVSFVGVGLLSGIIIGMCAHFAVAHINNIAYYDTGTFGTREVLKVGLILSTLGMLLVILFLPYWSLLGLL
jgi:DASS family divalent anion:Na+ symporter